jgi:hypothetical protein
MTCLTLTNNCCMHIPHRIRGTCHISGHYMRTRAIDDTQDSYNHEDEIRGIHVSMGNEEIESNGHRIKVDPVELV